MKGEAKEAGSRKQEQDRNPGGDGDGSGGNGELGMEDGGTGRWTWPMVMLLVAERETLRWSDNAEKGLDSANGSLKRDTARSGQNRTCINFFTPSQNNKPRQDKKKKY